MKKTVSAIISAILILTVLGGMLMAFSSCNFKGTTYYISSSDGSDENNGTSEKTPWKSFAKVNEMILSAGDKVLLKRGDVWHERLEIRGAGEKTAWIKISNYGDKDAEQPIISLNNDKDDIAVLVSDMNGNKELKYRNEVSYILFDGLDIRDTYLGIYFRFVISEGNVGFTVQNCNFKNITSHEAFMNELKDLNSYLDWMHSKKGNIPMITSSGYKENAGGADEYIWPDSIRVGGRALYKSTIASEFDVHNCVFEDAGSGLHISLSSTDVYNVPGVTRVRMYDCVGTGSYGGIYRFECVDGEYDGTDSSEWGYIRNVRHIGGSDEYAGVTGPTASYMAVCNRIMVEDCEMSYLYNNGAADGCGFDYETYVTNVTQRNMVYHNNDAEGILMLRPADGLSEYVETHLTNALFYNNIKRPLTTELNYDIMCGSSSKTISFKDIYIYMTKINPADGKTRTGFIGPLGNRAVKENNKFGYNEDYRTRFAFNGTSPESWDYSSSGISNLHVENGKLVGTLTDKNAYIVSSLPLNLFAYSEMKVNFSGSSDIEAAVAVKESRKDKFVSGNYVKASENTTLALPETDASFATNVMLRFKGNVGDTVSIDSIEYGADYNFSARLIDEGKTVRVTLSGRCDPMFDALASEKGIKVTGLPAGVTVTSIEEYKSDVIYIRLSDAIESKTEIGLEINADQFIPYFAEMLLGLDFGNRTAEAEKELFGYSEAQKYLTESTVKATVIID